MSESSCDPSFFDSSFEFTPPKTLPYIPPRDNDSFNSSLNSKCRRILRLCSKIEELALEDIETDTEEFLMNLNKVFLVLCSHLHTDIDNLENLSKERNPEPYISVHQRIENMYNQLRKRINIVSTNLVFEQKQDWFSKENEDKLSFNEEK